MNILKTPAAYAADLRNCFGPDADPVAIIIDVAKHNRLLPAEYLREVHAELVKAAA